MTGVAQKPVDGVKQAEVRSAAGQRGLLNQHDNDPVSFRSSERLHADLLGAILVAAEALKDAERLQRARPQHDSGSNAICSGDDFGGSGAYMKSDGILSNTLLFGLFLVVGLLAFFHPTILSGLSLIQTDPGDTRFNNYILEHGFRWLSGNPLHSSFWDPPIFYPAQNVAAFSDILLGAAPPYWLFRVIGLSADTAFQLWMLSMGILNFSLAYWTMRRGAGLTVLASAGGAYLFAFAAVRANQIGHQQLLPQFFSMIAVYCMLRLVSNYRSVEVADPWKTRGLIALLAASVVLQLYAGFYLGFFLCLGLSTWIGIALLFREGRSAIGAVTRQHVVTILLALTISLGSLTWMGYHYYQARKQTGSRPWSEVRTMIPKVDSWLDMGPHSWFYGWTRRYVSFSWLPVEHEHRMSLGLATLLIAGIGLLRMSGGTWGLIALLTALVIALVAFRYPWSITPWWVVFKIIPGATAIRGVTRISLLLLIAFSFGLAFFLDSIRNRKIALAILVLVCLEQGVTTPSYNKYAMRSEVSLIASHIPRASGSFYYVPCNISNGKAQKRSQPWKYQIDAMWAGLSAEVPTVNGYSGHAPPGWGNLYEVGIVSMSDEERIRSALEKWVTSHGLERSSVRLVGNQDCCTAGFQRSNCTDSHR